MSKELTAFILIFIILSQACRTKDKHPVILGNIVLNKVVDFKSPSFFEHLSEIFYIDDNDSRAKYSTIKISDAVNSDSKFKIKDSVLQGRAVSSNCFANFSRAYFFGGFRSIEDYQYYDSNFNIVKVRKLLGGIFHPFQIENILTGVQLDLCTYIPTSTQCPNIMVSTHFSSQVKNYFEQQMFEKYGKPDVVDISSYTLREKFDGTTTPVRIDDTSYLSRLKQNESLEILSYEWKRNGYVIRMVFRRDGPIFSDQILNPVFKQYEDKIEGRDVNAYLLELLKTQPSVGSFRIDLKNRSVISYDSFYGFIKYELNEDIQNEISNQIEKNKEEDAQKSKELREVF